MNRIKKMFWVEYKNVTKRFIITVLMTFSVIDCLLERRESNQYKIIHILFVNLLLNIDFEIKLKLTFRSDFLK